MMDADPPECSPGRGRPRRRARDRFGHLQARGLRVCAGLDDAVTAFGKSDLCLDGARQTQGIAVKAGKASTNVQVAVQAALHDPQPLWRCGGHGFESSRLHPSQQSRRTSSVIEDEGVARTILSSAKDHLNALAPHLTNEGEWVRLWM